MGIEKIVPFSSSAGRQGFASAHRASKD
uniref:Uncharacterized protein n=1 Tax=Anguilla anguilla TaxID=7936 RepID=A0A0E9RDK4_ANGAN